MGQGALLVASLLWTAYSAYDENKQAKSMEKKSDEITAMNQDIARQNTSRQIQILEDEKKKRLSTSLAKLAASGADPESESFQRYLQNMRDTYQGDIAWEAAKGEQEIKVLGAQGDMQSDAYNQQANAAWGNLAGAVSQAGNAINTGYDTGWYG